MKRTLLLKSKLLLAMLAMVTAINAQTVNITGTSFPSTTNTSCTNTMLDVSLILGCINATPAPNTVTVVGSTITVNINYTMGPICLGALSYLTPTINLGTLPPNSYTVIVNGVLNSLVNSTKTSSLTVVSCCGAVPSFNVTSDTICVGDSLFFNNTSTGSIGQQWFENNVSVGSTQDYSKRYNTPGTYRVKLEVTNGSCTDTIARNILVSPYPTVSLGVDTNICPTGPLKLNVGLRDSVIWNNSTTDSVLNAANAGTYHVRVFENGCESRDTINLSHFPAPPVIDFGPDTTICGNASLLLDATAPGVTYKWKDNSTNPTFTVTKAGRYAVILEDANTCKSGDSIDVDLFKDPKVTMTVAPSNSLCHGDPVNFTAFASTDGSISFQWKVNGIPAGAVTTSNKFTGPVAYGDSVSVDLITDICSTMAYPVPSNKIEMLINPAPKIITGPDSVLENTAAVYAVATTPGSTFRWRITGGTPDDTTKNFVNITWGPANLNAKVICVETDSKNCTYPNELPINLYSFVGYEQLKKGISIGMAYPNPSSTRVTIPILYSNNAKAEIALFDITGKKLFTIHNGLLQKGNITFSVEALKTGLYFYSVKSENGFEEVRKISVRR